MEKSRPKLLNNNYWKEYFQKLINYALPYNITFILKIGGETLNTFFLGGVFAEKMLYVQ